MAFHLHAMAEGLIYKAEGRERTPKKPFSDFIRGKYYF